MKKPDGWRRWRAGRGGAVAAAATVALVAVVAACGGGNGGGGVGRGAGGGSAAAEQDDVPRPAPGKAWVIFGADTVLAEVAGVPEQRERGLMHRDSVPDGTGMLFVFRASEERSFWMKDTPVSLDIAFFDEAYRIIAIKQMEAFDETLTDSDAPTALVLEVRRGWFAEQGIEAGATAKVVFGPGLLVR